QCAVARQVVAPIVEGLEPMVSSTQADEVGLNGQSATVGVVVTEGAEVVDVAVICRDRAARVPAGAVSEPDSAGEFGTDLVAAGPVRGVGAADAGVRDRDSGADAA